MTGAGGAGRPGPAEGPDPAEGPGPARGGGAAGGIGGSRPSGLRNPPGAVRGLGAGTLFLEAVVLLLAIQPLRMVGGGLSGLAIGVVCGLAGVALLLAGAMRRAWAWRAGGVLQVLLLVAGLVHWSLAILGLVFGAVWIYASHVRRVILG